MLNKNIRLVNRLLRLMNNSHIVSFFLSSIEENLIYIVLCCYSNILGFHFSVIHQQFIELYSYILLQFISNQLTKHSYPNKLLKIKKWVTYLHM